MWLMRLVGTMRDGRDFSRVLRIGFCCSEQERCNLKTTARCESQEVRRDNHRFCRSAGLCPAQRNPDHSISAGPHRRPLGNERLILANCFRWNSFPAPSRRRAQLFLSPKRSDGTLLPD